MTKPRIVAVDDGFAIIAGWRVDRIGLDQIIIVVAFKVDELTTDLICCDIVTDHGAGRTIRTIHEEIPGFTIALDRLAILAGFNHQ